MKRVYLVVLLLASIALSGCAQLDPEGTAIALADQLPEVRLVSKVVDSMQGAEQCTYDKLYNGVKRISEARGMEVSEPTAEQKAQAEAMIQQMGALSKRCQVRLSKTAEKESENVYMVHYGFETIDDPECNMLSAGNAQVRVDLSTGKAEAVGGSSLSSQDMQVYEQVIDEMGECAAITMIGFAQSGVSRAATSATVPPEGGEATTMVPASGVSTGAVTDCAKLPQDDKDACIRAMVSTGREPVSKCNEIVDEGVKASCIASASGDGVVETPVKTPGEIVIDSTPGTGGTAVETVSDCDSLGLSGDLRDRCVLRLVLNGSEPASKCSEIADQTVKDECIAHAPAS